LTTTLRFIVRQGNNNHDDDNDVINFCKLSVLCSFQGTMICGWDKRVSNVTLRFHSISSCFVFVSETCLQTVAVNHMSVLLVLYLLCCLQ